MHNGADHQLAGVTVVDLGIWRPAPYAAQLLAELGAEVVKVEPPGGDPMRVFPGLYAQLNGRKRVVELDLKHDGGQAELRRLMTGADVVIEGFRPGVAQRLGAGPDAVAAANPRAISCSISGFGQDGPLVDAPGHDLNYQAWAGALAPNGVAPDGVVRSGALPVADLAGGTFAALAICAALARRGLAPDPEAYRGEHIDVSMADVLVSWAGPAPGGDLVDEGEPGHGFPGYGTFRCADGAVVVGIVTEDRFWAGLCRSIGRDDLGALGASDRAERSDELRAAVAGAIGPLRRDEVVRRLLAEGVPVAPVLARTEALALPHFVARGVVTADGSIGHPVRFGSVPLVADGHAEDQRY